MSKVLPKGNISYEEIHNGMNIRGISYTEDEIDKSARIVADICFDTRGRKDFKNYVSSLDDTGFSSFNFVLPKVKDWKVGEGFAEAYLTAHFSCYFPWHNNQDMKNPNSSLTGADIVGFYQGQFAFGEVKTSAEQKYPPQVTSKKNDGLCTQLKKLCQDNEAQWCLVQYLYYRIKDAEEYKEAMTAYLKDNKNFYVFGVLVRDVEPQINDWNYLKKNLKVHKQNKVFLIALYLPQNNGIKKLHTLVLSKADKS